LRSTISVSTAPADAIAATLQELDRSGVRVRMVDHDERVNDYKSTVPAPHVEDAAIASMYLANFEELWTSRGVEGTGAHDHETRTLECKGDTVGVRPIFCPGRGPELAKRLRQRCTTRTNES